MPTLILLVLAVVAIVYGAICAGLYACQRSLQYFPQPRRLGAALPPTSFARADALLQLTVRAHPGRGAVLYFGGNGEDVSGSVGTLTAAFPGREIVMLHYRGYGGSTGSPTEQSLTEDAAALFDKVHAEHPDVLVIGRSLGSGVALRLASTRPVSRLILVTPYDSLLEIAALQFPLIPVRWLLLDKYESWRYVPAVRAPTLILVAEHDEIIPAASSERLQTRFPAAQVRYLVVAGASHNTIVDAPAYAAALADFDAGFEASQAQQESRTRGDAAAGRSGGLGTL